MQIDNTDMTVGGFILTWIGVIFGVGKTYGKLDAQVQTHDTKIQEIKSSLVDSDGDPKYLTKPDHDIIQANCQGLMRHRLDTLDKRMDIHDSKLDLMLVGIAELQNRGRQDK